MKLDVVVATFFIALPAAAQEGALLTVQELRSALAAEEGRAVDLIALADQVRDVARRILPDVEVLEAGETGTLAVSGELVRLEQGYLVSLELREAKSSKLEGTASASASTPEELVEAVASAAVDLFRGYKAASSLVLAAAAPPTPPAPLGKLDVAVVDANALVAIDEARSADAQNPDEAAAAWRAVAELPGPNPLRETAAARAKEWRAYADGKRAFEAQLFRDTARLRKVLPLGAVSDATKIELLVRYTRAYGAARASPLLSLVPAAALAAETREKACTAGDGASCRKLACDVPSALPSAAELWQRGCKDGDSISCALARSSRSRAGSDVGSQVAEATPGVRPASTASVVQAPAPTAAAPAAVPAGARPATSVESESNGRRNAGYAFLAIAAVVGGGALIMSSDNPGGNYDHGFRRNWLSEGSRLPSHGPTGLSLVLGGAAVLSATTGIGLLLTKPDAPSKLQVGVSPAGVALSGTLP